MDPISRLLDGPRAQAAPVLRTVMTPPWSILLADGAPLTLLVVAAGQVQLTPADGAPVDLAEGDVAVVRGARPWTLADPPGTPPQVRVDPGQQCRALTPDGDRVDVVVDHHGVRTWGNDPAGRTVVLSGVYESGSQVGALLLDALPEVVVLRADAWSSPLPGLLVAECTRDAPGQEVVLDRLLDLVLTAVLREWAGQQDRGLLGVHTDPEVARSVHLLQERPCEPWTVERLAGEVGLSRAALARRFADAVGTPPMAFLTRWRMAVAADLLRDPSTTLAAVARQVGYGTPFALSTAFRRTYGRSPAEHRRALTGARAPAPPGS